MTVSTRLAYNQLGWTGAETTFSPGFPIDAAADLKVYSKDPATLAQSLLTLDVHYAVAIDGAGLPTVTPIALPAAPKLLQFLRATSELQPTEFANLLTYDPALHTRLHDLAALRDMELFEGLSRSYLLPIGETADALPNLLARKGMLFGWAADTGAMQLYTPVSSQFFFLTVAPNDAQGNNGDVALNKVTGNLYNKLAGVWAFQGNIKGPVGDQGPAGSGAGDVIGPSGGTLDGQLSLYASTTGKAIRAGGVIRPGTLNSDQNDYNPTNIGTALVLLVGSDASRNITGLAARNDGAPLILMNNGSNPIVLKNASSSSSGVNRFALAAGDMTIGAGQGAWLVYDGTVSRWVALNSFGDFQAKLLSDAFAFTGPQSYAGALARPGPLAAAQITSDQNDYAPTGHAAAHTLEINSDAARNLTGLAGGADGRELDIVNIGSFAITLKDASTSSSAVNRFAFPAADIVLKPKMLVKVKYSASQSRWHVRNGYGDFQTAKLADTFAFTGAHTYAGTIGITGAITPTQIASDQNNYAPTGWAACNVARLSTDASRNVSGFLATSDGDIKLIQNVGAQSLVLLDESTSSTAANRLSLGADVTLGAKQCAVLRYDGTAARWYAIAVSRASGGGGGSGPADLDITLGELALGLADALNVAQFLGSAGNRFADSFDALTYVDVAGATNLDSGTAGQLKPTVTIGANQATSGNSISGGDNASFPKSDAFDGNNATFWGSLQISTALSGVGYLGNNLGSAKNITSLHLRHGNGTVNVITSAKVQYSDNGSAWTDVQTIAPALDLLDHAYSWASVGSHQWWRVLANSGVNGGGGNIWAVAEMTWNLPDTTNIMTAKSAALTAASAPASIKIVAQVEMIDSITLGTDLIFAVSRDGGTTFDNATMNDRFTSNSIHILESAAIDVTGQPSGTSVKWKITTANNKMVKIHGIYVYWT